MPRDITGRITIIETGDPLDPIDWRATWWRRLWPCIDGAFVALPGHLPEPLAASPKASPSRRYVQRFFRAFEYLRGRDGLPLGEQSCRSGACLELSDRAGSLCEFQSM
jgi:hypothetical protein